jgi:threonyl-tRNA synthetase
MQDDAQPVLHRDQLDAEIMGCIELVTIIIATLGMNDTAPRKGGGPCATRTAPNTSATPPTGQAEAACRKCGPQPVLAISEEPGEPPSTCPKSTSSSRTVIGRDWAKAPPPFYGTRAGRLHLPSVSS